MAKSLRLPEDILCSTSRVYQVAPTNGDTILAFLKQIYIWEQQ
jgi:hypothetical protein